jgi:hypothetical protein
MWGMSAETLTQKGDIEDAVLSVEKGEAKYIRLIANIDRDLVLSGNDAVAVIDLNGYTISSDGYTLYVDSGADITLVNTGDTTGKTCVLNASTIVCTVSASAQNSATLSSVTINGKNVATTTTSYTISNPTTNVFTITASDSRGFPNTATDTLTKVVDYFKPTITANFKRNTPTDGKVNLTYSGKVFNQSFGAKSNECKFYYDYKLKSASSYTSVELKPTITGDTFSGDITLPETYDYQQNYSFRLRVVDSLNTVVYAQDVAKGEPVFWWNENNFKINGCFETTGNIVSNGIVKGKMQNTVPGYVTSSSDLASYWFKVWDGYFTNEQYNDWSCTLEVNDRYSLQWGQLGYGIRQNGANNSGNYQLDVNLRLISGNIDASRVRLYGDNTTGYCALWVNCYSKWGVFPYKVVGKNSRTSKEEPSMVGTFYSGDYTSAQTLPTMGYVDMVDLTMSKVYPVGSIFMSVTNSANPKDILGFGTWVQIQGLQLVGAGTYQDSAGVSKTFNAGDIGGTWNHTHARGTLTAAISLDASYIYSRWDTTANKNGTQTAAWARNARKPVSGTNSANTGNMTEGTPVYGTTGATYHLQPALVVYMWRRTA